MARSSGPSRRSASGGDQRVADEVRDYIDGIAPENRGLFDRIHQLVLASYPAAAVVLSYKIPCYKVGRRRVFVGAWKNGVSLYGWGQGRETEFTARHPGLKTSKGTIHLRPADAADVTDDELLGLIRAALED